MPLIFNHRFALALFRDDGSAVATVALERDWEPDQDWARFYFQRKGELPCDWKGSTSVVPMWDDAQLGEPYCRGYRIEFAHPGGDTLGAEFRASHLRPYATSLSSRFVETRQLREGETFTFALVAYPAPAQAARNDGSLQITDTSPALPVRDASVEPFLRRARASGDINPLDMPVFVRAQVLADTADHTHAHTGTEVGGILLGKLWRDPGEQEIFAEVTALIPAEHAPGTAVKLTFTPDTWAAADAARQLRHKDEIYAGWAHSHPVRLWCASRKCTLEEQKNCKLASSFFSEDDQAVMRAAFANPYAVAIVANDTAVADLTFSMFGNREGLTQPRGFYVLEED